MIKTGYKTRNNIDYKNNIQMFGLLFLGGENCEKLERQSYNNISYYMKRIIYKLLNNMFE